MKRSYRRKAAGPLAVFAATAAGIAVGVPLAEAYVTSANALPAAKQIDWLRQLSGDIVTQPVGELSDSMLESAPHVVRGWCSSSLRGSIDNAVEVERIIKRLVDESTATGNDLAAPSTKDYNCLLEEWSRSGAGSFAAERCEQILQEMEQLYHNGGQNQVQPNLSSFKAVLLAWRHSKDDKNLAPVRAQRVLEWMVRLYAEGTNTQVLPDADCYDTVLQSWSHSSHPKAPHNAETLLGNMEKLYEATGNEAVAPRTLSFNAVLGAWLRSKDTETALPRMFEILEFMEALVEEGNHRVTPDKATFSMLMTALSRSKHPKSASAADALLRKLEQSYKEGSIHFEPDKILFNSAIGCMARPNTPQSTGAYRKARSILDRQLYLYEQVNCKSCKPDVVTYTSVISSCASEPGTKQERSKAFSVALATYQELTSRDVEFGAPNHVTYGSMLKACARLLPRGSPIREKWTKKLFLECQQRGQVGDMVLSRVREAASPELYKELLKGKGRSKIPHAWRRNVSESNEYRRKVVKNRKRAEV